MMKMEHIVGDLVCIVFRDPDILKEINLGEPMAHLIVRGFDKLGLWVAHPGLVIVTTEDKEGKPIPPKKQVKEEIDASVLITWDNIISIMHYPHREGFDFPSEFDKEVGFKLNTKE